MTFLPPATVSAVSLIDAAYVSAARNGDGAGIAMSAVSNECLRSLFYQFRWVADPEQSEGRKERIFKTGNLYETRLLDDLRAIGCDIQEIDETTGSQMKVELAGGHLRGKVDGRLTGFHTAPELERVVEAKSMNERSFKALVKAGNVREGKAEHYAQIQMYLHGTGIRHGIYIAACKNDDAIYVEEVPYDAAYCLAIEARIQRVIDAQSPPARLYDDPNAKVAFTCNFCRAKSQCHEGAFARVNCRTCLFSEAHDGPRWVCTRDNRTLSYRDQQAGCAGHRFIPGLVPGEQIDADQEAETITYQLADGAVWVDGAVEVAA
ncbi:oxidoreductase [Methylobacterium sp. WL19]|uniref:oxidoreductase n=1 Tax=Methylobacterium sp. WL19 TaxID=2603896 RepID=UPI0011CBF5A6|nr:oxidoreductase [Methylobacterium sp. WL19]TXN33922.1 oxidoreductase [Methylobacterium sp. WL19]